MLRDEVGSHQGNRHLASQDPRGVAKGFNENLGGHTERPARMIAREDFFIGVQGRDDTVHPSWERIR